MPSPRVSVVISTFERPARLALLLEGLARQTLGRDEYEVIVVDDGSGPATVALLGAAQARGRMALSFVRHPHNRGQSAGRNTGWRRARAALVAFTDDDCVPSASWLAALLEAADEHPGALLQGPTLPDPSEAGGSMLMARTVRSTELGPQYETCNIAYPRAVLAELGGFDERWAVGEDTDLAYRALETGHRAAFVPAALVHHAVEHPGSLAILKGAARWGGSAHLFAAHPQARAILHRRLFWNPWHYLLIRSLVALGGPSWLRRLVLTAHLAALGRRGRGLGAGLWSIPYLLLYDVVETVAIIRGAVRHRTPLL